MSEIALFSAFMAAVMAGRIITALIGIHPF